MAEGELLRAAKSIIFKLFFSILTPDVTNKTIHLFFNDYKTAEGWDITTILKLFSWNTSV